ncbi:MAG: serine protease [Microgenomates group bacterium]
MANEDLSQKPRSITRRQFLTSIVLASVGAVTDIGNTEAQVARLHRLPELKPKLPPEVEKRVKNATMMIGGEYVEDEDDSKRAIYLTASAFHITGDGTILTNFHVVDNALSQDKTKNATQAVKAQMLSKKEYASHFKGYRIGHPAYGVIPVELVYADPKYDFAVLRYDTNKYPTQGFDWIPIATEKPKPGDTVYSIGYNGEYSNIRGTNEIQGHREIYLGTRDGNMECIAGIDTQEYHPQTEGGSSGSPLVNGKGEVVAIHAGSANNATSFAAYVQHVTEFYGYHYPGIPSVTTGNVPISLIQRAHL